MSSSASEPVPLSAGALPDRIHHDVLVRISGVSDRQLRKLSSQGVLPPFERATWPAFESLRDLVAYYRRLSEKGTKQKEDVELELKTEQVKKLKLHNARVARQLVNLEDTKRAIAEVAIVAKEKLEKVPDKLASRLVGRTHEEIHKALASEMREILEEMAREPNYTYADDEAILEEEGDENSSTAAKPQAVVS